MKDFERKVVNNCIFFTLRNKVEVNRYQSCIFFIQIFLPTHFDHEKPRYCLHAPNLCNSCFQCRHLDAEDVEDELDGLNKEQKDDSMKIFEECICKQRLVFH